MPSPAASLTWAFAPRTCGGIFDFDTKQDRLIEVGRQLEQPNVWSDAKRAQELGREKKSLEGIVGSLLLLDGQLRDAYELFEIARAEADDATLMSLAGDIAAAEKMVAGMEFRRMFSNALDPNNCFLDIQSGSGGTEAQDWAAMLERMYLKYCERSGFGSKCWKNPEGEVAGIKSATIKVSGEYAYGRSAPKPAFTAWCANRPSIPATGANVVRQRLRLSEVDDTIAVEINPADLRIDTYRASGAGGQHINKTDSAVRITHLPTNIVVQCQNDRSQHRNRAEAMAMLKSRLYEREIRKRQEEQQKLEDSKTDIGWGHQIRSYVLDQSRIKDLRTGVEIGNTQGVLDGDLDVFIEASLKQGV
jgi:peptide chain release factor 2